MATSTTNTINFILLRSEVIETIKKYFIFETWLPRAYVCGGLNNSYHCRISLGIPGSDRRIYQRCSPLTWKIYWKYDDRHSRPPLGQMVQVQWECDHYVCPCVLSHLLNVRIITSYAPASDRYFAHIRRILITDENDKLCLCMEIVDLFPIIDATPNAKWKLNIKKYQNYLPLRSINAKYHLCVIINRN